MKFSYYLLVVLALVASASARQHGEHIVGETIDSWVDHPDQRKPEHPLAFVEVVSIADERHTFTNAQNSSVSDDNGKTWYNLLNVRSGMATLKVIESPGVEMPATITVYFERPAYVRTRETPVTDWLVHPGDRLLGFFSQKDGKWTLQNFSFIDPVPELLFQHYASRLQSFFKNPLSDAATLARRKREYDEARERAKHQAETNHIDQK